MSINLRRPAPNKVITADIAKIAPKPARVSTDTSSGPVLLALIPSARTASAQF